LAIIMSIAFSFIIFKYCDNSALGFISFILFSIIFSNNAFKDSIKSLKESCKEFFIKYIKNNNAKFYTLLVIPIIYLEILFIILLLPFSLGTFFIFIIILLIEMGTWMMIVLSVIEGKSSNETIGKFFADLPTRLIKLVISILYETLTVSCVSAKTLFLSYLFLGGFCWVISCISVFKEANQFYIYISAILIGLICACTTGIVRWLLLRFKPKFIE
ncbi:MAG: hypothetical protein Q7T50_08045, partial [Candidatus Magasanikbacteria bacterium]|nr:hypothetical protein [Candidatus Magasanikbacteria bacterium]